MVIESRHLNSRDSILERAKILERMPTVEEYTFITHQVMWSNAINYEVIPRALRHSLYGVVAVVDEAVVGMGRIVGDNATFFYIQDVAVIPTVQNCGIGSAIMDALMIYLEQNAPDKACIALFSSWGSADFYERFGFSRAPQHAPGMYRLLEHHPDE